MKYKLFHIRHGDPIPHAVDGYLGLFNHSYAEEELQRFNEEKRQNVKGGSWRDAYLGPNGRSNAEIWVIVPVEAAVTTNEWGEVGF